MTRGRQPGKTTKPDHPVPNDDALAKASAALTEMGKRSAEVAERFADGLPYDRERVVAEARYMMAQSAEAMLEAGKRLVQLKENEPFGDFTTIVEQQLGLNVRTAQLMMAAAVKYLSPALGSKAKSISLLGKSKLFDLMVESDEDLADLAEGGTIAGKTLGDMQAMTRRELQDALVDERQTRKAKEKLIAKRDARISELEEAAAELPEEAAMLQALHQAGAGAQVAVLQLAKVASETIDRYTDQGLDLHARQSIEYIAQLIANFATTHGITIDLAAMLDPPWARAVTKPRKAAG